MLFNMCLNEHQKRINLGEWKFVCFVKHGIQAEQTYFDEKDEYNRNIMILVERQGKIRLITLRYNPWLKFDQMPGEDYDNPENTTAYKGNWFMQTGVVAGF